MSSTRRSTALAFISAFEYLDIPTHMSLRTPTCTQIFAPSSIHQPPPLTNSDFSVHLSKLKSIISHFPVWPKEIIEDERENRVVIWATSEATFKDEVRDEGLSEAEWGYKGEYVFMLTLDESGERIEKVVEFLDSKAAERARGLVRRALGNLEHGKEKIEADE
ncbi:hypothetical protein EG329_006863 [Mollisiaceae sp. DMI_Dod_QoI]|nr:hypothetical protein EG329_006863 [Helotiales sp. DMI_Dod_QoI]